MRLGLNGVALSDLQPGAQAVVVIAAVLTSPVWIPAALVAAFAGLAAFMAAAPALLAFEAASMHWRR